MTKKHFDDFIFDDDILKELPEFKPHNATTGLKKRRTRDNKKVLFRDNLSQMVEPVESFMLSVPRSEALDSQVLEDLEDDYKNISNNISDSAPHFKKPVININSLDVSDIDSRFDNSNQYMRSMTSSEVKYWGLDSESQLEDKSIELESVEEPSGEKSAESVDKKSLDLSVHGEIDGPNIVVRAESISTENDKVIHSSKQELSYEDKKGHYRFENNGSVSEGDVEAESYNEFLKKIYEPLIGHQMTSSSDISLESGEEDDKSRESQISAESKPNELIINISHEEEEGSKKE